MGEPEPYPNLGGYKIVIMNAKSALSDIDPFLENYQGVDKNYKQRAWKEVEQLFNCTISVEAYPDTAPWGPKRQEWIKENSMKNLRKTKITFLNLLKVYKKLLIENGIVL